MKTFSFFVPVLCLLAFAHSAATVKKESDVVASPARDESSEECAAADEGSDRSGGTGEAEEEDLRCYGEDDGAEAGNGGDRSDTFSDMIPIFMIPSFAGTRLRTWKNIDCGRGPSLTHFHVGGTVWLDLKRLLAQASCWLRCIKLIPESQDDPVCMTRPDHGIDAITQVDETVPVGFLWKAMIHMLASGGYEPEKSLFAHPYDWRLAPGKMEDRDEAFSKLRRNIEAVVSRYKRDNPHTPLRGVCLIGFSLGNLFIQYFFKYMEVELGKRGLERWADEHVHVIFMAGSPFLGAPAIVESIMVGETMGLPLSVEQSRDLMLTFGSMPFMMPTNTKVPNARHSVMNHGETDFPVRAVDVTLRNGTTLRPENGDIVTENGWFGKIGEDRMTKMQHIIDKWYANDPYLDGMTPQGAWSPPNGIDHIICAYGVNLPTAVGHVYKEHPKYDGYFEETDVLTNDRGDITSKDGTPVLPKERRHATRRSGDGSVPYYSLSWCHSWFGTDRVNITKIPANRIYEEDEVEEHKNVDVLNPAELAKIEKFPHGFNTFYEKRWVETHPESGLQRVRSLQVWELEGIIHRDSVTDQTILGLLKALLIQAKRVCRQYVSAKKRMIQKAWDEIEEQGMLKVDWLEKISLEGAFFHRDDKPEADKDCYWDYANVRCAWPRYCIYKYKLGDVTLSQSCRLRPEALEVDDPELLLRDAVAHNVSYNVSNQVEWRVVYRDVGRKFVRPWFWVFVSFVGGALALGILFYGVFAIYHKEIVKLLKKRSRQLRKTLFRSESGRLTVDGEVDELSEAIDELEDTISRSDHLKSVSSQSDHGPIIEGDVNQELADIKRRIHRLSMSPHVRALSQSESRPTSLVKSIGPGVVQGRMTGNNAAEKDVAAAAAEVAMLDPGSKHNSSILSGPLSSLQEAEFESSQRSLGE